MRKIKKYILLGVTGVFLVGSLSGCSLFQSRQDHVAETNRTEKEIADELMKKILDALETENADALKHLFSVYAQENAYDLDGKIQELMEFYPGSEGG